MTKKVELGNGAGLIAEDSCDDVSFFYINQSYETWRSDVGVEIDIDRDKAIEIIAFLKYFYKITEEEIKLFGIK